MAEKVCGYAGIISLYAANRQYVADAHPLSPPQCHQRALAPMRQFGWHKTTWTRLDQACSTCVLLHVCPAAAIESRKSHTVGI